MKIAIFLAIFATAFAFPQAGKQYPIKLQPELDNINFEEYIKNDKLLSLQIKCVIYDGPCDAVGKWLKPRIPGAILGECLECTPKQTKVVQTILTFMQEKKPEDYKAGIVKFISESGINVGSSNSTSA